MRLPVDDYEIARCRLARERGKAYRPLVPPPPSGFVEFVVDMQEEDLGRLRETVRFCRERGEKVTRG